MSHLKSQSEGCIFWRRFLVVFLSHYTPVTTIHSWHPFISHAPLSILCSWYILNKSMSELTCVQQVTFAVLCNPPKKRSKFHIFPADRQDSSVSVGTATRLGPDDWGIGDRFWAGARDFYVLCCVKIGSFGPNSLLHNGKRGFFPGEGKATRAWNWPFIFIHCQG
jgi:hypothetical protein